MCRFRSLYSVPVRPKKNKVYRYIFTLFLLNIARGAEVPSNPFLADSPWPMTHRNPYCQASSPFPGPTASEVNEGRVSFGMLSQEAVAITLNFSPLDSKGEYSVWAGARKMLYEISPEWKETSTRRKEGSSPRALSGAYTVLDREGRLFIPRGNEIQVYRNNFLLERFGVAPEGEMVVGLNLTYDGFLVWVSDRSLVGVMDRDAGTSHLLRLSENEEVSNSIALDEEGGIYVVTDSQMYRVQWGNNELTLDWKTPYPTTTEPMAGRLGLGSGTTPTLMGWGSHDKLVVIADGQEKMHIVAFWRATGKIAGSVPILFGDSERERAITEQSLLVHDYDAVAVNNDYGKRSTSHVSNMKTILLSNSKKIAPYGMEKFHWDERQHTFLSVWSNQLVSVPNGIPTMSSRTGLIYYVGQHDEKWTMEGVNWETGNLAFRYSLADRLKYNSFYAATEIGYDGAIVSGTFGGAMRLLPR